MRSFVRAGRLEDGSIGLLGVGLIQHTTSNKGQKGPYRGYGKISDLGSAGAWELSLEKAKSSIE